MMKTKLLQYHYFRSSPAVNSKTCPMQIGMCLQQKKAILSRWLLNQGVLTVKKSNVENKTATISLL